MKVDIFGAAPALVIGSGEERFTLRLRRPKAGERNAVIDGYGARSVAETWRALAVLIEDWEFVVDGQGNAIPYSAENAEKVFGAIPARLFDQTLEACLAFIGVKVTEATAPTTPPDGATPNSASGG